MIFIAKGADASANNLGQISIKTIDDVLQSTLDLITEFGSKTFTDEQIIGLDTFLVDFNAWSSKSKVKIQILPILLPNANGLLNSDFVTGTPYLKNLADPTTELILSAGFLNTQYGLIGVRENGYVMQNATDDGAGNIGTIWGNSFLGFDSTSFGITNKNIHFGVYVKSESNTAGFSSGGASNSNPFIAGTETTAQHTMCFNSIIAPSTPFSVSNGGLIVLNGKNISGTEKSYINSEPLVNNTYSEAQAETVQTQAPVIKGGSNGHNDTAVSFMTFGESLTDEELIEYSNMVNKLMNSLVV
jgi:hypothetical protein